jgi:hypothetical protein
MSDSEIGETIASSSSCRSTLNAYTWKACVIYLGASWENVLLGELVDWARWALGCHCLYVRMWVGVYVSCVYVLAHHTR